MSLQPLPPQRRVTAHPLASCASPCLAFKGSCDDSSCSEDRGALLSLMTLPTIRPPYLKRCADSGSVTALVTFMPYSRRAVLRRAAKSIKRPTHVRLTPPTRYYSHRSAVQIFPPMNSLIGSALSLI